MSRKTRSFVYALSLSVLCSLASAAYCQQGTDRSVAEAASRCTEIDQKKLGQAVFDAIMNAYESASEGSPSSTEGSQTDTVTLEIGEANGRGLISWKPPKDPSLGSWSWLAKVSAPTDKNSGITDFVTLDGLAKDLALEVEWSRTSISNEDQLLGFFDELDGICDFLDLDPCVEQDVVDAIPEIAVQLEWITEAEMSKAKSDECWEEELARLIIEIAPARAASAKKSSDKKFEFVKRNLSTWSIASKVSQNKYRFFNLDSTKGQAEEFGMGVKLSYTRLVTGHSRLSFSVEGQRSYKDGTTVQHCSPVESSVSLETCETLPLGEPVRENTLLGRAEYRFKIGKAIVSPLFSYNFEEDIWGIDLPFYLKFSKDEKTSGGFRIGWRSDTEDVVSSIFVSQRVKLLEN